MKKLKMGSIQIVTKAIRSFAKNIFTGKITLDNAYNDQSKLCTKYNSRFLEINKTMINRVKRAKKILLEV